MHKEIIERLKRGIRLSQFIKSRSASFFAGASEAMVPPWTTSTSVLACAGRSDSFGS